MTQEELETLLQGQELFQRLDVKTLVLDRVRQLSPQELEALFYQWMSFLSVEQVKEYLYIKRD